MSLDRIGVFLFMSAPDVTIDALWVSEAEDCLAAYGRGDLQTVSLASVLAKYIPG